MSNFSYHSADWVTSDLPRPALPGLNLMNEDQQDLHLGPIAGAVSLALATVAM